MLLRLKRRPMKFLALSLLEKMLRFRLTLVVPETTISSSSLKFMLVIRLSPLVIAKHKLSAQRRRVIKEVSKLLLLPPR